MPEGPTYQFGDMWQCWNAPHSAFIITSNAYINQRRELTMGRGIAEQLRNRDRRWATFFGEYILHLKEQGQERYGCLVWDTDRLKKRLGGYRSPACWIGVFQVKYHFRDPAVPELIEHSVGMLRYVASQHRRRTFNLNYPGIGFGRLTETVVEPLLRPLPPNVHVWRFGHQKPLGRVETEQEQQ